MRLLKKLRARRGESLAETLCALLVAGLAVSLLAGMVGAASRMASNAEKLAGSLYEAVSDAEKRETGTPGTVTVTVGTESKTVEVNFYGDADEVQSYARTEGGGA